MAQEGGGEGEAPMRRLKREIALEEGGRSRGGRLQVVRDDARGF